MKKFEFSLERLKQFRGQVEETEKNRLGELRAQHSAMQTEEAEIIAEIARKNDDLRALYVKGAFPAELSAANRYISVKKQELELKRRELELKKLEIDKQLSVVLEATREVQKLEKLEEHQLEDYHELEKKEQEKFIEEFVSNAEFRKKEE